MKKEKNEFKEMNTFVDMLIDEGVKAGTPFYINLKNRETEKEKTNMKKEIYEFICPVNYLTYIFNGDTDGITEEEINRIEDVLSGFCCFSVKEDEPFFTYQNDFNFLGVIV